MTSGVRRRHFIQLSALGVTLMPALGSKGRPDPYAPRDPGAPATGAGLAVGYWLGSEGRTDLELGGAVEAAAPDGAAGSSPLRADVVPAESVLPDPELDGGATVTVHGLHEAGTSWQRPEMRSLALSARYPLPDSEAIDFLAWSHVRAPLRNDSSPIRFAVPTGPGVDLTLGLARHTGPPGLGRRTLDAALSGTSAGETRPRLDRVELSFSSRGETRTPKLRRGVYFVAVSDRPCWARLAWDDYGFRLTSDPAAATSMGGRLERVTGNTVEPADFDYLVVSIDPPESPA